MHKKDSINFEVADFFKLLKIKNFVLEKPLFKKSILLL